VSYSLRLAHSNVPVQTPPQLNPRGWEWIAEAVLCTIRILQKTDLVNAHYLVLIQAIYVERLKHQSPALGSQSPDTSPCWVRTTKSPPASLCYDQPTNTKRLADAPLQCRLFQPKVQGTSSEPQIDPKILAGIQGTNNQPVHGIIICELLTASET